MTTPRATDEGPATILLAYDGSEAARNATAAAVALLRGRVVVLHVWGPPPIPPGLAASPMAMQPTVPVPQPEEEQALEGHARDVLAEGVALCRDGGLAGDGVLVPGAGGGDVARAILAAAEEHGADVIVLGRRDRSALSTAVLGSVSKDVVADADRPVLVVGPPDEDG